MVGVCLAEEKYQISDGHMQKNLKVNLAACSGPHHPLGH